MNTTMAARLLFETARHRYDHSRMLASLIGQSAEHGECEGALAEQARCDETEARFCLLRAVLLLADPSAVWHQNDTYDDEADGNPPLCSVVAGGPGWQRGFSVVPVPDGIGRWGNALDLVVTNLETN